MPARELLAPSADPGLGVLVVGGRAPGNAGRTEGFTAAGGRAVVVVVVVAVVPAGGLASGGAVGCSPGLGGGSVCPGGRCGTAPGRGAGLAAGAGVLVVVAGEAAFGAGQARGDSVALVAARGMAGLIDGGRDANGLGMLLFWKRMLSGLP